MTNTPVLTTESYDSLQEKNEKLEQKVAYLTRQLTWYEEQLRLAQHKRFGASSERSDADQLRLFNEVEETSEETGAQSESEESILEKIMYERRKKQPGHREEMLRNLPVERIEYRLEEDQRA